MNHWSRKQTWTNLGWSCWTKVRPNTAQPEGLHLCNYDTVIYSNKYIYLVFISIDGTELQKLSEFLSDKSYKAVLCNKQANPVELYLWMLVKWLWTLPKDGGLVTKGTNPVSRSLEASVPPPNPWREDKGWRLNSVTHSWCPNASCPSWSLHTPKRMGFKGSQLHAPDAFTCQEGGVPQTHRDRSSSVQDPPRP